MSIFVVAIQSSMIDERQSSARLKFRHRGCKVKAGFHYDISRSTRAVFMGVLTIGVMLVF